MRRPMAENLGHITGFAALLVFVGGLAGCSSESTGCVTNNDCAAAQQCIGGACVGAQQLGGCTTDDECPIGEFCDPATNTCAEQQIVNCSMDNECPSDLRCNTTTGVCVPGNRSCTAEADCVAAGKHCDPNSQQCVDCYEPGHCLSPTTCVQNRCIDPSMTACTGDAQCMPPQTVCQGMQCVAGCGTPGSPITCGLGSFCNTGTGRCEMGQVTCANDTECAPPNTICESMQCIPGCAQVGGLVCTGGNVCNPATGRCEASGGCTTDVECGAPAQICESGSCVPGCAQPGAPNCPTGTVCDGNSGRCVMVQGPCTIDSDCNPPAAVCEAGQCIGGCGEIGGIVCSGNTTCNMTTGRCDPGGPVCMNDADCQPPSTICNTVNGQCEPSCLANGCPMGQTCNQQTGRCTMNGAQPLNGTCTANTDCQSGVCFDLGNPLGFRCISACGNTADCPGGFTCFDFFGSKMCVLDSHLGAGTFATPNGGACSAHDQCQSYFCPNNQCVDVCDNDSDCGGGACQWYEWTPDRYIGSCNGPLGAGANGSTCSALTDCRSGVCYGNGTCGDVCGSSADCPNGNVCAPVNFSVCVVSFGVCFEWAVNFVKACVQATHGTAPDGTTCADANGSNCRGGFCLNATNTCAGTCSTDADCPAGLTCTALQYGDLDGQAVYVNVCSP
ncbi:MAG: hypothetical protein RIU46_27645 [Deltaproteobacteria bacterium]